MCWTSCKNVQRVLEVLEVVLHALETAKDVRRVL